MYDVTVKCAQLVWQQVHDKLGQLWISFKFSEMTATFRNEVKMPFKRRAKIPERSGVCPNDHMDSSGVASACNLDMRPKTSSWMGLNACPCVDVPMHAYVLLCVRAGCMCTCVKGPWHLLMKKSSLRVLLWSQAALHSGSLSHHSVVLAGDESLIREMLLSLCLCTFPQ